MLDQCFAQSVDMLNLPDSYYRDPYPTFAALRAHDPVHRNADGTVILTRYSDNDAVWCDLTASVDKSEMFTKLFGEGPLLEHWTHTMLFRDPPEHKTLRKLTEPFFSRKNVRTLRGFVEETVERLIE
ncbi:MAG: cytochrome P450, partial [Pseudomonadota bacterium]